MNKYEQLLEERSNLIFNSCKRVHFRKNGDKVFYQSSNPIMELKLKKNERRIIKESVKLRKSVKEVKKDLESARWKGADKMFNAVEEKLNK